MGPTGVVLKRPRREARRWIVTDTSQASSQHCMGPTSTSTQPSAQAWRVAAIPAAQPSRSRRRRSIGIGRPLDRGPSVVVGNIEDLHAASVVEAVEASGGRALLFDAESLNQTDFILDDRGVKFFDRDDRPQALGNCRGWMRRIAPEKWHEGVRLDGHSGVVRQAWGSVVASLAQLAEVTWLSDLPLIFAAENKLVQLRACRELGFRSPPTVLVTRRDRIPAEFGDDLVVKPYAAGHFREDSGDAKVVFATAMARDDPRLDLLAGAPFLVQSRLDAIAHRRIVTVKERAWVCEISAEGVGLDWRATEQAHTSFRLVEDPEAGTQALRLAKHLKVGYSSQDWLVDQTGESHLLDLNPAGQWMFLPAAEAITSAIADWLMDDVAA
jgi:hypothetical protein